jgi:hypothetical protein
MAKKKNNKSPTKQQKDQDGEPTESTELTPTSSPNKALSGAWASGSSPFKRTANNPTAEEAKRQQIGAGSKRALSPAKEHDDQSASQADDGVSIRKRLHMGDSPASAIQPGPGLNQPAADEADDDVDMNELSLHNKLIQSYPHTRQLNQTELGAIDKLNLDLYGKVVLAAMAREQLGHRNPGGVPRAGHVDPPLDCDGPDTVSSRTEIFGPAYGPRNQRRFREILVDLWNCVAKTTHLFQTNVRPVLKFRNLDQHGPIPLPDPNDDDYSLGQTYLDELQVLSIIAGYVEAVPVFSEDNANPPYWGHPFRDANNVMKYSLTRSALEHSYPGIKEFDPDRLTPSNPLTLIPSLSTRYNLVNEDDDGPDVEFSDQFFEKWVSLKYEYTHQGILAKYSQDGRSAWVLGSDEVYYLIPRDFMPQGQSEKWKIGKPLCFSVSHHKPNENQSPLVSKCAAAPFTNLPAITRVRQMDGFFRGKVNTLDCTGGTFMVFLPANVVKGWDKTSFIVRFSVRDLETRIVPLPGSEVYVSLRVQDLCNLDSEPMVYEFKSSPGLHRHKLPLPSPPQAQSIITDSDGKQRYDLVLGMDLIPHGQYGGSCHFTSFGDWVNFLRHVDAATNDIKTWGTWDSFIQYTRMVLSNGRPSPYLANPNELRQKAVTEGLNILVCQNWFTPNKWRAFTQNSRVLGANTMVKSITFLESAHSNSNGSNAFGIQSQVPLFDRTIWPVVSIEVLKQELPIVHSLNPFGNPAFSGMGEKHDTGKAMLVKMDFAIEGTSPPPPPPTSSVLNIKEYTDYCMTIPKQVHLNAAIQQDDTDELVFSFNEHGPNSKAMKAAAKRAVGGFIRECPSSGRLELVLPIIDRDDANGISKATYNLPDGCYSYTRSTIDGPACYNLTISTNDIPVQLFRREEYFKSSSVNVLGKRGDELHIRFYSEVDWGSMVSIVNKVNSDFPGSPSVGKLVTSLSHHASGKTAAFHVSAQRSPPPRRHLSEHWLAVTGFHSTPHPAAICTALTSLGFPQGHTAKLFHNGSQIVLRVAFPTTEVALLSHNVFFYDGTQLTIDDWSPFQKDQLTTLWERNTNNGKAGTEVSVIATADAIVQLLQDSCAEAARQKPIGKAPSAQSRAQQSHRAQEPDEQAGAWTEVQPRRQKSKQNSRKNKQPRKRSNPSANTRGQQRARRASSGSAPVIVVSDDDGKDDPKHSESDDEKASSSRPVRPAYKPRAKLNQLQGTFRCRGPDNQNGYCVDEDGRVNDPNRPHFVSPCSCAAGGCWGCSGGNFQCICRPRRLYALFNNQPSGPIFGSASRTTPSRVSSSVAPANLMHAHAFPIGASDSNPDSSEASAGAAGPGN